MKIKLRQHEKFNSATLGGLTAGVMLATALGGCNTAPTTSRINVNDNRVVLSEMRVALNFDHEKQASSPHTGHALELSASKTRGSATNSLESGQLPVVLHGVKFTSPQQLKYEFEYEYGDIAWRWRKFFNEGILGLEVTAGHGYTSVGLKVSSATQAASDQFTSKGPRAGIGLILRLNSGSSLQARALQYLSFDYGVDNIKRVEIVYAKTLFDNFNLRAGYAGLQIWGSNHYGESDFKFDMAGPVLALDFSF